MPRHSRKSHSHKSHHRTKRSSCSRKPPCPKGMSSYKMRKGSGSCCRKSWSRHIGPTQYGRSPWLKFLREHKGKGLSRKQLSRKYHQSH